MTRQRNWKCKLGFHEDDIFSQEDGKSCFLACSRCGMCIKSEKWSMLSSCPPHVLINVKPFSAYMDILQRESF